MSEEKAVVDQSVIDQLNKNGGVNRVNLPFIPIIRVNNTKKDGQPEADQVFTIAKRNEKGDFVVENFEKEFDMRPFKVRYRVDKKYKKADTSGVPNFKSFEFDTFFEDIKLTFQKEVFETMKYKEFKEKYKDNYVLYTIVYFYIDDIVYRLEVKGSSRTAVWDYMKEFGSSDSMFSWVAKMTIKKIDEGITHNALNIAKTDLRVDINKTLTMQTELNNIIKSVDSSRADSNVEVIKAGDTNTVIPSQPTNQG